MKILTYIVSIIITLSLITCEKAVIHPTLGSFTKLSFQSNDARIEAAFRALREDIIAKSNNKKITIMPIAVYSQMVNGINYKIITAIKDEENYKFNLSEGLVYLSFDASTRPIVKSFEILEKKFQLYLRRNEKF